ncbi:HD domain-containing protein [Parabacteroides sp. PF5-9]|uniref:HD domain-containing protein n=1 Tax=Parabacteroides sp. PF5-9 TaxID=1742404 RepID=UPI002477081E|nr:HD domain-containing protein [Parabacteroides sp. PF5-9]MDH6358371.1 HD superfamily phosphodiesterase [Parabacteroides sp. PF5-9]
MKWNTKDRLALEVVGYYARQEFADKHIIHTQAVANYTRLIAVGEGMDENQSALQEIAAWFHDIGCPESYKKFGNTLPVNQQREGYILTQEWLKDEADLSSKEKEWLADVVATHHQFKSANELGFLPLFEADLIVNLLDGYYSEGQEQHLYDKLMQTKTGKELFEKIFSPLHK